MRFFRPVRAPLVWRAYTFARLQHRHQSRKDATRSPYMTHLRWVTEQLLRHGVRDPVALAAALLHDTVEDQAISFHALRAAFGEPVARAIRACTDDHRKPKVERKRLQIERARHAPRPAALVKLADKTANLHDVLNTPPPHWSEDRKRRYFEWAWGVVSRLPHRHRSLERDFDRFYALGCARFGARPQAVVRRRTPRELAQMVR